MMWSREVMREFTKYMRQYSGKRNELIDTSFSHFRGVQDALNGEALHVTPPAVPKKTDTPCPWRSPLSSYQRPNSAGSAITGSCCHQEVQGNQRVLYQSGITNGMGLCPWLQKFHK